MIKKLYILASYRQATLWGGKAFESEFYFFRAESGHPFGLVMEKGEFTDEERAEIYGLELDYRPVSWEPYFRPGTRIPMEGILSTEDLAHQLGLRVDHPDLDLEIPAPNDAMILAHCSSLCMAQLVWKVARKSPVPHVERLGVLVPFCFDTDYNVTTIPFGHDKIPQPPVIGTTLQKLARDLVEGMKQ